MPLFSLPNNSMVGDLGKSAYGFADFLRASGQEYWQILPLCPIDEYFSPYKSTSSFAGEILYINLEFLCRDGLLFKDEIPNEKSEKADYITAKQIKLPLLKRATERFDKTDRNYRKFLDNNEYWLQDYAVFCVLGGNLKLMPDELKYRNFSALERFKSEHESEIDFYKISQYLFYLQFNGLRNYLKKKKIKLIGDIPFYVSGNSSDVWTAPDNFSLLPDYSPASLGGTPPDKFSKTGQVWDCPVYDFDYQKRNGYDFWRKRLIKSFSMYDCLRIDHFRAFANYYQIPCGKSAVFGEYKEGVGAKFFYTLSNVFRERDIIAENLGGEKDSDVNNLLSTLKIPDMRVLQFGFDSTPENTHLPQNYPENCVAYTGTHDNDTCKGWYQNIASKREKAVFNCLIENGGERVSERMIRAVMNSRAKLAVIPFFDYTDKSSDYRINTPGTNIGNWTVRASETDFTDTLIDKIKELSKR